MLCFTDILKKSLKFDIRKHLEELTKKGKKQTEEETDEAKNDVIFKYLILDLTMVKSIDTLGAEKLECITELYKKIDVVVLLAGVLGT